jgi:predicted PurR-regulated permease PerM
MKSVEPDPEAGQAVVPILERRLIDRPFVWGFNIALGIAVAAALLLAAVNLSTLLFSIFMAAFITVGLDPLVRFLQSKGMKRGVAILVVVVAIIGIMVAIVWVVAPSIGRQIAQVAAWIPIAIAHVKTEGWFGGADGVSNGILSGIADGIAGAVQDPGFWATVGGGVTRFGLQLASSISGLFFVLVLTIYFISSYDATKGSLYRLINRSNRQSVIDYSEQILQNVGRYLSGMVTLAFLNATYSTILLLIIGVPGALLIGIIAFFITIIPLIGTVLTTVAMSLIAFIYNPSAGLIVLIFMLIYMQVEAYLLTPRVMSKAVKVPGSVVLISAIAGGTLFGLPGALVAIPISAGILLIITGVVMPRKEAN